MTLAITIAIVLSLKLGLISCVKGTGGRFFSSPDLSCLSDTAQMAIGNGSRGGGKMRPSP